MKEREFGESYLNPIRSIKYMVNMIFSILFIRSITRKTNRGEKNMSVTLRVILIVCSFISFFLCIKKIKQSKLKVANSVTWMLGSIILILMSIFSNAVAWLSQN